MYVHATEDIVVNSVDEFSQYYSTDHVITIHITKYITYKIECQKYKKYTSNEMIDVLGQDSALQCYTGPGTWANEMNFTYKKDMQHPKMYN